MAQMTFFQIINNPNDSNQANLISEGNLYDIVLYI